MYFTWVARVSAVPLEITAVVPKACEKSSAAFCKSVPVSPNIPLAALLKCFEMFSLSTALLFRFLCKETDLSSMFFNPFNAVDIPNADTPFTKTLFNSFAPALKAFPPSAAAALAASAAV